MDFNQFLSSLIAQLNIFIKAPLLDKEIWWILIPLIIATLVMTFYFSKYKKESGGWNAVLGNSIVLLFVCVDLLRIIYNYSSPSSFHNFILHPLKLCAVLFVILESILLAYFSFKQKLPKAFVFFMSSPLFINIQSYFLSVIIYLKIIPNWFTLLTAIILFLSLFIVLKVIQEVHHLFLGYHFKSKNSRGVKK